MACPAVITGDAFVTRILTHIDCQASYLGSYGYQSLADPGSPAAQLMAGLLTVFVALWGLRLLLGPSPAMRDVVTDGLKVGIALTLAFSWPAFRTVIHDVVLDGPAQIASSVSTPGLANSGSGLVARLQNADNAIARLTEVGTGRRSGQYIAEQVVGGTFESVALEDSSSIGWARVSFLVGLIGTLALVRIGAGLLLALAPLAAGMLLFPATRGLFAGWVRGLVFAIGSAVAITFTIGIELAIIEPWLADALRVRQLGYATPAAPVELLAMTMAFTLVHIGMIWGVAKVSFHSDLVARLLPASGEQQDRVQYTGERPGTFRPPSDPTRAEALASHLETRVRLEQGAGYYSRVPGAAGFASSAERDGTPLVDPGVVTASTSTSGFRRTVGSSSMAAARREGRR